MQPQPFNPSFGVPPNILALTVSIHAVMGPQGLAMADFIVAEAHMDAYEVSAQMIQAHTKAAAIERSRPKHNLSRKERRLLYRNNPELKEVRVGHGPAPVATGPSVTFDPYPGQPELTHYDAMSDEELGTLPDIMVKQITPLSPLAEIAAYNEANKGEDA